MKEKRGVIIKKKTNKQQRKTLLKKFTKPQKEVVIKRLFKNSDNHIAVTFLCSRMERNQGERDHVFCRIRYSLSKGRYMLKRKLSG